MKDNEKIRLDVLLTNNGLAPSRTAAKKLIQNGNVLLNNKTIKSASHLCFDDENIEVINPDELLKYVSRGGYKLECAAENFGITLKNKICLDIGASTGGFTDFMLQKGAKRVYCVDVGKGQLHEKLRQNDQIISYENTDIRNYNFIINENVDFITVDVSFISLTLVIPELIRFSHEKTECVLLIKPQFEIGKKRIKNGIVKNKKEIDNIINNMRNILESYNYETIGIIPSNIKGSDGNQEYLCYTKIKHEG